MPGLLLRLNDRLYKGKKLQNGTLLQRADNKNIKFNNGGLKMNNNTILDLISEAYEYINEVKKYGTIDEADEEMLDNALAALTEAQKEIENEEV